MADENDAIFAVDPFFEENQAEMGNDLDALIAASAAIGEDAAAEADLSAAAGKDTSKKVKEDVRERLLFSYDSRRNGADSEFSVSSRSDGKFTLTETSRLDGKEVKQSKTISAKRFGEFKKMFLEHEGEEIAQAFEDTLRKNIAYYSVSNIISAAMLKKEDLEKVASSDLTHAELNEMHDLYENNQGAIQIMLDPDEAEKALGGKNTETAAAFGTGKEPDLDGKADYQISECETKKGEKFYVMKETVEQAGVKAAFYSKFETLDQLRTFTHSAMTAKHPQLAKKMDQQLDRFETKLLKQSSVMSLLDRSVSKKSGRSQSAKAEKSEKRRISVTRKKIKDLGLTPYFETNLNKAAKAKKNRTRKAGAKKGAKKAKKGEALEPVQEVPVQTPPQQAEMPELGVAQDTFGDFFADPIPRGQPFYDDRHVYIDVTEGASKETQVFVRNNAQPIVTMQGRNTFVSLWSAIKKLPSIIKDAGAQFMDSWNHAKNGVYMPRDQVAEKAGLHDLAKEMRMERINQTPAQRLAAQKAQELAQKQAQDLAQGKAQAAPQPEIRPEQPEQGMSKPKGRGRH